jgi:hypothetical protein
MLSGAVRTANTAGATPFSASVQLPIGQVGQRLNINRLLALLEAPSGATVQGVTLSIQDSAGNIITTIPTLLTASAAAVTLFEPGAYTPWQANWTTLLKWGVMLGTGQPAQLAATYTLSAGAINQSILLGYELEYVEV